MGGRHGAKNLGGRSHVWGLVEARVGVGVVED